MFQTRKSPVAFSAMFCALAVSGAFLSQPKVASGQAGTLARNCKASFMPKVTPSRRKLWKLQNANKKVRTVNIMRRAAAWKLGKHLSLCILGKANGVGNPGIAQHEKAAKTFSGLLKTPLPQIPSLNQPMKVKRMVTGIGYLLRTAGPQIGSDLSKFGPEHPQIFELAVKTSLLGTLYNPAGNQQATLALCDAIERSGTQSGISPEEWKPLVESARGKKPAIQVRKSVASLLVRLDKILKSEADRAYKTLGNK